MTLSVLAPIEPVAPSMLIRRLCIARSHSAAYQMKTACSRAKVTAAATRIAAMCPSSRSSRPPWPGISVPASLTPKRRFSADSARSPAWASSAASAETVQT